MKIYKVDILKIILVVIVSLGLAYVGLIIGDMIFSAEVGSVIGFLLPSVCLLADMHTKASRK